MENEKQRERLVELIANARSEWLRRGNDNSIDGFIADFLIANGVNITVMCCECKYCETVLNIIDEPKLFCTRVVGSIPVDFTDYCSYGKLKEKDNARKL